ncbi:MAG: methionine adenosyltransferase [Candidatus Micrarchaeaceae archaeon]
MRNIKVHYSSHPLHSERKVEYVERKGIGHPDSLIDGIVDFTSNLLCRNYIEEFGTVLHHNVDKGLIIGGESRVGFGYGKIVKKIEVIVAGRATSYAEGKKIDVDEIAKNAAEVYLSKNTRFLDVNKEVKIYSKIRRGSGDLVNLFHRGKDVPLANDTSFGLGFAPLTKLESLVLNTEKYLNSKGYKRRRPEVGEDIKVMGLREGERFHLTVAIAFVSRLVYSEKDYLEKVERVKEDIKKFAEKSEGVEAEVGVNTGDHIESGSAYITKSGLSCEAGDDGSVGRGNRVNGLITPFRHMSLEAAAGKNPISHIGKIYNIISRELSKDIVERVEGVDECNVGILSQIGKPIDQPHNLSVEIKGKMDKRSIEKAKIEAEKISNEWLDKIKEITEQIALGRFSTF